MRLGQSQEYLEDYDKTEREHREIVAALKAGNVEMAIARLCAHLSRGAGEVLSPETESAPAAAAAAAS